MRLELILFVDESDIVDSDIEIRSRTEFRFMEITVDDDFLIGSVIGIGINVSSIGSEVSAAYLEGGSVESLERTVFEFACEFFEFCFGAFSGNVEVDSGKNDGAGGNGAGPVSNDSFAGADAFDDVFVVRSPVDGGRNNEGVGAGVIGSAVVGYVGNAVFFAGGRSAERVGVLADKVAASADESESSVSFFYCVIPGTGELNVHGNGRANGASAEEEGGITGDNFCIGESAYVTDLCVFGSDLNAFDLGAVGDHFVELHSCGNAGKISAFVNGSESVVIVGKSFGVSLGAGSMAELNFGEFFCGFDHEIFMTERIGKYNFAALAYKVFCHFVAFGAFGDAGFDNDLFIGKAESLLNVFHSFDEVKVIGGFFIVETNETDLEIAADLEIFFDCGSGKDLGTHAFGIIFLFAAGCESEAERSDHCEGKYKSKYFFEHDSSSKFYFLQGFPRL